MQRRPRESTQGRASEASNEYKRQYYKLVKHAERWKNIQYGHELYCAGHLIEAAVAYQQATGKRKLLDVAIKLADHIDRTFGPDKKVDTSGHEEIELALVKLYRATKQERYLKLAQFFLDMRGRQDKRRLFGGIRPGPQAHPRAKRGRRPCRARQVPLLRHGGRGRYHRR